MDEGWSYDGVGLMICRGWLRVVMGCVLDAAQLPECKTGACCSW